MDEIYQHALKLLKRRDYTVAQIRQRLLEKFGEAPQQTIDMLLGKRFLDDRRFADNIVSRSAAKHPSRVREELEQAGVPPEIVGSAISGKDWPSLQTVLKARMETLNLRAPLQQREAARLFRALSRLGYQEDEIREELEQLHDQ
jgi:SOS response regulatory protein OraA/RecX